MELNLEKRNAFITTTKHFSGGGRMSWNLWYLIKSRNEIIYYINSGGEWKEGEFSDVYKFFNVAGPVALDELYQREMIKNN